MEFPVKDFETKISARCAKCHQDIDGYVVGGDAERNSNVFCYSCFSAAKQPKFYCAANLHDVPKDAIGKEWEFSENGHHWLWFKAVLKQVYNNKLECFFVKPWGQYSFMRPVQLQPEPAVTIVTVEEVRQKLSDHLNNESFKPVNVMLWRTGKYIFVANCEDWYHPRGYTRGDVEQMFKCEMTDNNAGVNNEKDNEPV